MQESPFSCLQQDSFLFFCESFLSLNTTACQSFQLEDAAKSKALAVNTFHIVEDTAISQTKSSFGGFDLDPNISETQLLFFIKEQLRYLKNFGIRRVFITSFPECYDVFRFQLTREVLLESGFYIDQRNISQYINISNCRFSSNVAPSERRYLNKANGLFKFNQLDIHSLKQVYELIVVCRQKKNYPVTMSFDELYRVVARLPERYLIFGLFDDERMIAGAVVIKINGAILYDFYHGDDLEYRKFSPVVPLIEGIYNYAQESGARLLDLGVSTDGGIVNKGIYDFKRSLGAADSEKIVFVKEL